MPETKTPAPAKARRRQVDPKDAQRTATAVFRVLRRAVKEGYARVGSLGGFDAPDGLKDPGPSGPDGSPPYVAWFAPAVSLLDARATKLLLNTAASEADELAAATLTEVALARRLHRAGVVEAGKSSTYTPETPHLMLTHARVLPGVGRRKVWLVPTRQLLTRMEGRPVKAPHPLGPCMPLLDRPAATADDAPPATADALPSKVFVLSGGDARREAPVAPAPACPGRTPFDAAMSDVCRHMESARLALEAIPRPAPAAARPPLTALAWAREATLTRGESRMAVVRDMQRALSLLVAELPDE